MASLIKAQGLYTFGSIQRTAILNANRSLSRSGIRGLRNVIKSI